MSPRATGSTRLPDVIVDDDFAGRVRAFAADRGESISDVVRRGLARVTYEPSPYRFSGSVGPSLVRDLADLAHSRADEEARDRVLAFEAWTDDQALRFERITTTTAGDVVPPGFRHVGELVGLGDRPLWNALSQGTVMDGSPFTVPRVRDPLDVVDPDRTEGNQPAEGTLVTESALVQPAGVTGELRLTRELVDSASPSGDAIALSAAAEDWRRQVEQRIYGTIETAQAGAITSGFTPNGVQASTSVGAALVDDLQTALARYASVRRQRARNAIVGEAALSDLAGYDSTANDSATWRRAQLDAAVHNVTGQATVIITGGPDVWAWNSPLLRFRYDERQGPAEIIAGVFGYSAAAVTRPRGLSVIRWTAT